MGSQKGNNNKGTGSIRDSGMVKESSNKFGPAGSGKKNKQGFNNKGTAYGGKLAAAMSKANAPKPGASSLDKAMTRRDFAFSPEDVAAAAGRLAATKEMENQFGSRNKARASFAGLIDAQQDRLNNYSAGPRFRDELGQVREAPNTFARSVFNKATGVNPTTGMGILDSLKHNYAMSQGIPGSGLFGAGLSLASGVPGLGILANPILERFFPSQDEEDVNKFGMPEYDLRTINEYRTNPTYNPAVAEAFDPSLRSLEDISNDAMSMRAVPKLLRNTPRGPLLTGTNVATTNQRFKMPNNRFMNFPKISSLKNFSVPGILGTVIGAGLNFPTADEMDQAIAEEKAFTDNFNLNDFITEGEGRFINPGFKQGGLVPPQAGPMSSGIGTLYKLK
jgi:hypothetical protein